MEIIPYNIKKIYKMHAFDFYIFIIKSNRGYLDILVKNIINMSIV